MPNYVVIRLADIPSVGQGMSGLVRVENAVDEPTACQQALAAWGDTAAGGVVGATLASNVSRHTFAATHNYTVT